MTAHGTKSEAPEETLRALHAWWEKANKQQPADLTKLEEAIQPVLLHPDDSVQLGRFLVAASEGSEEAKKRAWINLFVFVTGILDRYRHPIPEGLLDRLANAREELQASRGPPVLGDNGSFRRGDLVCLPDDPDDPRVLRDGLILDFEPSTPHAKRFGRMVAIQDLTTGDQTDRWFLDRIYHGVDFGRPY